MVQHLALMSHSLFLRTSAHMNRCRFIIFFLSIHIELLSFANGGQQCLWLALGPDVQQGQCKLQTKHKNISICSTCHNLQ